MMTAKEILTAMANEVRDNPTSWTQGVMSRDTDGEEVDPNSPDAVCWCASGFPDKYRSLPGARNVARRCLLEICGSPSKDMFEVWAYNDGVIETSQEAETWFRMAAELCS